MHNILSLFFVFSSFFAVAQSYFSSNFLVAFTFQPALCQVKSNNPFSNNFQYQPPDNPQYREVRINEIMPDFSPALGLPEAEFIELYNPSTKPFDLADWKYSDATTAMATLPPYILEPGGYVILCRVADTAAFKPFGPVLGLRTFPALNDGGDEVEIMDASGKLIDKVSYTSATYQDAGKAAGGWSLELINPTTSCNDEGNYKASSNPAGGTPGTRNAVFNSTPDTQPPVLQQVLAIAPNQLKLYFSERLDSLATLNPALFSISGNITVIQVSFTGAGLNEIILQLSGNLQPRTLHTFEVTNIRDCPGNILNPAVIITVALPEAAVVGDVVINEILFNPQSGGVDFVELINRSPKFINLQNWQLGDLQPDATSEAKLITEKLIVLAPQQYLVLTTRPEIILAHYPAAKKEALLAMPAFPAFPDDAGSVVLLDANQKVVDQFAYTEKMHFSLLDDVNGVSLERIRLAGDSSASNWHSAASSVGYATPGYQNSQHAGHELVSQVFTIDPKIFTPDNDGQKDFTSIRYEAQLTGMVANITIFDAQGREIKRLVKNELLGRNASFQWDGLDEKSRKVPVGYYILFIELFNGSGQVKAYKETVVVGARFN